MKFPYLKLDPTTYRPIVPIYLSYKNGKTIKYFGLVDSGADYTLIAKELAPLVGINDITTGKEGETMGIGGKSKVYYHPVTINIGGHDFNVDAGFTPDSTLDGVGHGLLGQVGLFDSCAIKFDRRKFELEINPFPIQIKSKK